MKHTIMTLAFLVVILAGCGGDTTDYETTTTTYTTTTTAELSQDNNKAICVGLLNIGSCNTVQVNTQAVNRPSGSPAPTQQDMTGAQMVGTLVLLCIGFVFVVGVAGVAMGSGGYN